MQKATTKAGKIEYGWSYYVICTELLLGMKEKFCKWTVGRGVQHCRYTNSELHAGKLLECSAFLLPAFYAVCLSRQECIAQADQELLILLLPAKYPEYRPMGL